MIKNEITWVMFVVILLRSLDERLHRRHRIRRPRHRRLPFEMGNHVRCVDKSEKIISTLRAGRIHIFEPRLEELVRRNLYQPGLLFRFELKHYGIGR